MSRLRFESAREALRSTLRMRDGPAHHYGESARRQRARGILRSVDSPFGDHGHIHGTREFGDEGWLEFPDSLGFRCVSPQGGGHEVSAGGRC